MLRYIIIINILFSVYYDIQHLKKKLFWPKRECPSSAILRVSKEPSQEHACDMQTKQARARPYSLSLAQKQHFCARSNNPGPSTKKKFLTGPCEFYQTVQPDQTGDYTYSLEPIEIIQTSQS